MKITSFLLVFLLSFPALAKVEFVGKFTVVNDVTFIKKDDKAPYTGYLFTEAKTEQVRKELIEKDQLKLFNQALKDTIAIQDKIIDNKEEQVKLLSEQNTKLVKKVEEVGQTTNFEKVLWFGLGIAATSLAIYGASSLVRH